MDIRKSFINRADELADFVESMYADPNQRTYVTDDDGKEMTVAELVQRTRDSWKDEMKQRGFEI